MLDGHTTAATAANHTIHLKGTVGTASSGQEQEFDSFLHMDNYCYAGCLDTHLEAGTADIPPSREERKGRGKEKKRARAREERKRRP